MLDQCAIRSMAANKKRPFLVFDFQALWRSRLSARVPESQKTENGRLASLASNPWISVAILGTLSGSGFDL